MFDFMPNAFSLEIVDELAEDLIPAIQEAGYIPGGVLPSEMLAFIAFAKLQMCNLVIESGRHLGFSTRLLGQFFDVISIDNTPIANVDEDIKKNYPRVDVKVGQCDRILKKHMPKLRDKRIALLLDGPKGMVAYRLIKQYAADVTFGAIHDVSKYVETPEGVALHQARIEMEQIQPPILFTDDEEYVERYGWLDDAALYTGYKDRKQLVARGFTLAFVRGQKWA